MTIARLNNGAIVLAKMYKGKADALTYANRTQAAKAVAKAACLGINCAVMRFGRPFFAVVMPDSTGYISSGDKYDEQI